MSGTRPPILRGATVFGFDEAVQELQKLAGRPAGRPVVGDVLPSACGNEHEKLAAVLERASGRSADGLAYSGDPVKLASALEVHARSLTDASDAIEKAAMVLVAAEAQEQVIQGLRRSRQ